MSSSQPSDIPPFYGAVETTMNALRLIHAARQGIIPRITRRLNDAERRSMIKSGAVFVFSVEESGIKRWTGPFFFLLNLHITKLTSSRWFTLVAVAYRGQLLVQVYREINERTNSRGSQKRLYPSDETSRALSVRPTFPTHNRDPLTAIPDPRQASEHGTFKPNGLIKKTITVTIEGSDLHLISYYTASDQHSGKLKRPTCRPDIMALTMDPRLFRSTNFRVPPKVEKAPDGTSRLIENEEADIVECKVEEEPYNIDVSTSPSWATTHSGTPSPIESPFVGGNASAMFPVSPHSSGYSRHNEPRHGWVGTTTSATSLRTNDNSWASNNHYGNAGSRRENDGWGLSAARWSGHDYTQGTTFDRSRSRATNPYPSPLQISRREPGPHHNVAEARAARLPWLQTDKADAPARPVSQASSFSPPASQIYTTQGYMRSIPAHNNSQSYSPSTWSHSGTTGSSSPGTSGALSSAMSSPQSPFSPPPSSLHSYGSASSYAPSSGGLSSPEEYPSNADGEYGDS
ncbi:hypothetical protein MIND_00211200 [Mycena indigotica]|uniref:Uncharacterized protein n=1 Tax=Mycena indigotica TaxID=2126181 RepID=A0A8H6T6K0_9AGAR|nr:uncharacterized protein MIND_00211200 [Mycena indigotica]KAF7311993.1 hypothetical protein MIND_00211200 [Mycena indigotica]